jgi:hypothetical protein
VNRYLVDSNVILDLILDDPNWADWSMASLSSAASNGMLCINPIIYTEISIGFERIETLEDILSQAGFLFIEIPREALFLAGKAFMSYRIKGGRKKVPLPDFYIGAHAAVSKIPLITRDVSRYGTYFPTVELIHPGKNK